MRDPLSKLMFSNLGAYNSFDMFQSITVIRLLVISPNKTPNSLNDLNVVNDGRKEPIHTKEARADRNQGVFNVVKIMFLPFPPKVGFSQVMLGTNLYHSKYYEHFKEGAHHNHLVR